MFGSMTRSDYNSAYSLLSGWSNSLNFSLYNLYFMMKDIKKIENQSKNIVKI